uniref:Fibrinogen C-terminal domain-containing protein n=1 Tax=Macrostomum lignano TaxID=282301 RepID=A0A1I8HFW0_9PLAT
KAVRFAPGGSQFYTVRSKTSPVPSPKAGPKVVFQQHLDNSLSFAQNWDTYVTGFGDLSGNYWMGLEQLSAMTKDRSCSLTFEGIKVQGSLMRATFKGFQVRGANESYRLMLGDQEPGGDLYSNVAGYHNGSKFSTYNNDNDKNSENAAVLQLHLTRVAHCRVGFRWTLRTSPIPDLQLIGSSN